MAAEWWELAIPAAGVLAGASVTLFGQGRIAKRQRETERRLRLFDQKRETYAAFMRATDDLRDLVTLAGQVGREAEKEHRIHEELGPWIDEGLQPGAGPSEERARQIERLTAELGATKARREDARQKATAAIAKLSEPGGLFDVRATIRIMAPKSVRDAAERMEKLARDPESLDEFLAVLEEF